MALAGHEYQLAPPMGVDPQVRRRFIFECNELSETILTELVMVLNLAHGTSHTLRYWRILLGHWLLRFVSTLYHRYHVLEQTLTKFGPLKTTILRSADYKLATKDSLAFIWATDDDFWNHTLFGEALVDLGFPGSGIEFRDVEAPPCFIDIRTNVAKKSALRNISEFIFNSFLPTFSKSKDAFVIGSYLPLKSEMALQFKLGQMPQRWSVPNVDFPLPIDRTKILSKFDTNEGVGFERFVRRMLLRSIPSCFLEGYQHLTNNISKLPWPENPAFIFTSSNFDTDELFKGWAAAKVEKGTPYFAGQHGNNYGTHIFVDSSSWPEKCATDAFLSWGWSDTMTRVMPAFNFKCVSEPKNWKLSPEGGLLLIEVSAWHAITPWDSAVEHQNYLTQQFRFVNSLAPSLKAELIVRMHPEVHRFKYHEFDRWSESHPDIVLDNGLTPLSNLIQRSRLVVHSYDSTGILEMLSANQPFICFWPNGWEHLVDSAVPYYELLREADIFQDSPEQAASKTMEIWDDVQAWWLSSQVQQARNAFCEKYSRNTRSPATDLARLFSLCLEADSARLLSPNVKSK
jgi:putative transferase (TIGR04331 family)